MACSKIGGSAMSLTVAPTFSAARTACAMADAMSTLAASHRWVRASAMVGSGSGRPSTRRSRPLIAAAANATSATPAANSPTVSSDHDTHFMPGVGNNPYDGLKPATPQNAAGRMTEPPVWLPNATGTIPAATAAAEPQDDPPGVWARLHGLRVGTGA